MDISTGKLLAQYNKKTNNEMNSIIRNLNITEWNQNFKGYFNSVNKVCNHLIIGDFNWLKRFSTLKDFDYIRDSIFDKNYDLQSIAITSVEDYIVLREKLDIKFLQLADELIETDFNKNVIYKNFKGESQDRNFGGLLLHVFNHQTHHRGMISIYLDILGKENDFSNLLYMV